MLNPRSMLDASFRAKVLVPVIACMIVLIAVTVLVVNRRVTAQFQAQARETLAAADAEFRDLQKNRSDELLLRFRNLPSEPRYRAAFQLGDPATLHQPLADLLGEQGADIVFYATSSKKVLAAEKRDPSIATAGFETAAAAAVRQALTGQETVDTVQAGGRIYNVVSIPVYVDRESIGALTFGLEIGDEEVQKFSQLTHSQIALLAGGRVVASAFSNPDANAQFTKIFTSSSRAENSLEQIILGAQHDFGMAGRFDSLQGDKSLGYVLVSSYEDSLRALQRTQQVLLAVSLCAILTGAVVVWLLVNRVTRPLRELRDGAEAVGRGDFTRRVPVRSRDECGELADVFNQMTENLQQSRAQLERTVETLKTTQQQLIQSEKLSAVGEFVAGVTHELNNPLTTVMGFSELLQKADVDPQHQRHLDMIFKSAQRCQKIVQSLLSFARRQQPERKPVPVNGLIDAVLEIVSYPLRTSNIEVVKKFASNLPMVLADTHQIQQVLLNIINNARQAMEAHQPRGQITITTQANDSNVRITIQDSGPGISPENLRRIFDPFFTTKEVGKGTGLGLSLCYGIIKEHGGTITPLSRPGEGATFIIELPIAPRAPGAAEPVHTLKIDQPNLREGQGRRVLVIDDEEGILQMISEDLSNSGYQVDTAIDGETGLRRLKQKHYDATLCDWKMPGLNGRQVYEQLRATNPRLCKRLIFITGDVINEPMRQFLETEQRPCLAKPFTFDEFHNTLKTVLEKQ